MMIKKYKKKPLVIDAIKWNGMNTMEIINFVGLDNLDTTQILEKELVINTLEDGHDNRIKHVASVGDYIIKGIRGEFYPCKAGIFEETYDDF